MGRKRNLLFLLLAVCLMWAFRPETVSAADGEILVNGTDILTEQGQQVPCGTGKAEYNPDTKTLTLNQAVIENASCGIEIGVEGVTVELIGENKVTSKKGLLSSHPVTVQGSGGGKIVICSRDDSYGFYGLHVTQGGLTVRDADLQFIMKNTAASDAAIDIRGGDNLISNTRIEITMETPQAPDSYPDVGIDATDASSLIISDGSSIVMHQIDQGIAVGDHLTISGSSLAIEGSGEGADAVVSGNMEILNGSIVTVAADHGPALAVSGELTISGSTVKADSAGSNGIYCRGSVEISGSSDVKAAGFYPGIYADGTISVKGSSVEAESSNVGIQCKGLEITDSSNVKATGYYPGIFAMETMTVKDSSVESSSDQEAAIFCGQYEADGSPVEGLGTLEIIGSEVKAISENKGGILINADLTITDSKVISSGQPDGSSISAIGDITVTGGTAEIGNGWIYSEKNINIGGVVLSNGIPSYSNIKCLFADGQITFLDADYSAVDKAVAKAEALDKADYTNYEIVEAAIKAVVRGKDVREQAAVDGYAAAIEAAVAALVLKPQPSEDLYQIIEGADQTVVQGEGESIMVRANGDFGKFVSVSVDGNEVAKENYTAASGSTVITFKPEYVKALTPGIHTVTVHFTDGEARTTLTVKEKEKPEEPGKPEKPGKPDQKPPGTSSGIPSGGQAQAPGDGTASGSPQQQPKDQTTGQENPAGSPRTGDHTAIGWLMILAAFSAAGLTAVRKVHIRNKNR